jgi:hypothetical protein
MTDFRKVVGGGQAWSGAHSQRIRGDLRPGAESRVKGRLLGPGKIEIRTGARVTRTRGLGTWFKSKLNATFQRLFLKPNSKPVRQRQLRRLEHEFDRHVNRLVEDLANKGDRMTDRAVADRLRKIEITGRRIERLDKGFDTQAKLKRFEANFRDSLGALAVGHPDAFARVRASLGDDGPLARLEDVFSYSQHPEVEVIGARLNDAALPDRVPSRTGGRMAQIMGTAAADAGLVRAELDRQMDKLLEDLAVGAPPEQALGQFEAVFQTHLADAELGGFVRDPDERGQVLQEAVAGSVERLMARRDVDKMVALANATGRDGPLAIIAALGRELIENGTTEKDDQAGARLMAQGSQLRGTINSALRERGVPVDDKEMPGTTENWAKVGSTLAQLRAREAAS